MSTIFDVEKQDFITNFNLARPIMTVLGDEVRQEILVTLIERGGTGGVRVGEIQKPMIRFWNQAEPMLKSCIQQREKRP